MKSTILKPTITKVALGAAALTLGGYVQAGTVDLTTGGTSSPINGAIFTTSDSQATGSGTIQSFLRVSGNESIVDGYNTSARPVMSEVNTSPTFTRNLTLGQVPIVTIGGLNYYEFLLDINQQSADPFLSLDKVDIRTSANPLADLANNSSDTTLYNNMVANTTLRYSLDAAPGGDSTLLLNYNLNSGSGSGDLFAYIPVTAFGNALATDYVTLYSQFGGAGEPLYGNNDGYEEWAVRTTSTLVPEPHEYALLGLGFLGLAGGWSRLRRKTSAA